MKFKPALSLIELLLVVSLIGILSLPGVLGIINIRARQSLDVSTNKFAEIMRQAHIFSRENRESLSWGVKGTDKNSYQLVTRDATKTVTVREKHRLESPTVFIIYPFEVWFDQGTGNTEINRIFMTYASKGGTRVVGLSPTGLVVIGIL
ncbi:MAG: hypothetical protein UX91_C0005G0039 [Candidatus Amesbacteria bacterium GW2011_GWB1_47_19]|nr:MAG: hypothetical protein UW51_C0007G0039 [Candidatus Amesbacteria bacterium GW2011_GWA1_44_24]KKU31121.1 MAG: hypothetical protein UX46_C0007G0039 [Candidatus Amesbacteria bacterium GW2011_GWC1_46_24]KKU67242.1 MAG: hypothetical protein UX91_C0005G0039 [Candidatus Amesbacteria bacterium GW2011_GWB1_47_19]OGD05799.1 MAG: hypothetical protein A2379_01635 [Candidatus Amesbacteria bacterium RIFOXYB1_FULL_47_13]HBC72661.1 hypothetical protein [Candidatus Amesbacteria bacterium]